MPKRSSSYNYDPATGQWTKSTVTVDEESSKGSKDKSNKKQSNNEDNLSSTSTDKDSSKGDAEKKSNTIEYNTLSGTLNFIATNKTIKLKAGDTIKLKGLGKYLSGKYYVQDVTRSISSSGYSHSATIIKTDFGKSLKSSDTKSNKETKPTKTVQSNAPSKDKKAQRTYTVKKGDCLWKISKQYYKDGASYTKIAKANNISAPYTIYVGQVLTIP